MGVFKRISSEGGEEFLKMFTQDAEKVQKALGAELTTEVTDNGDTVVIKRTWTAGGQSKSQENTIKCGQESELTGPLGTTYKAVVKRDGNKLTTNANGVDVVMELADGKLTETYSAKGKTFVRVSQKQ